MANHNKGDDSMAIRKEDVKNTQTKEERRLAMKELANRIADRNDEALRRLSKN